MYPYGVMNPNLLAARSLFARNLASGLAQLPGKKTKILFAIVMLFCQINVFLSCQFYIIMLFACPG